MEKQSHASGRLMHLFSARLALTLVAAMVLTVPIAAHDGLSWRSYAEAGGGISITGHQLRPLLALESGIIIGAIELGSHVRALPLEFGGPDLIQAAAVAYGGSIGYTLDTGDNFFKPFGRIGLGGIYASEADGDGGFSSIGAEKKFSGALTLGVALPVSERWSARLWGSYRMTDNALDFEGTSLTGFDIGASIRASWTTTVR